MLSFGEAKQTLESAGQAHVLQFWPELSEEERDSFLRELAQLDLRGLRGHCEAAAAAAASPPSRMDRDMEPIPPELIGSSRKSDRKAVCQWESEGNTCKLWTAEVFKSFKIRDLVDKYKSNRSERPVNSQSLCQTEWAEGETDRSADLQTPEVQSQHLHHKEVPAPSSEAKPC